MFIAGIQIVDFLVLGAIAPFLLFFVAGWVSHLYRLHSSSRYTGITHTPAPKSVSVIVPVVDEPMELWREVLSALRTELIGMDSEVFVVCNGGNGVANGKLAQEMGFNVVFEKKASKRNAIAVAARKATKELCIILDSDTIAGADSIRQISRAFPYSRIGGVTPRHSIFSRNRNFWRRMSDWMEDNRFNNSLKGLSVDRRVNCLPGRLFAIRTELLKKYLPKFTSQTLFGRAIETGDDRVLTQWMLEDWYYTLYDDSVTVKTNAPDTFKQFAKQRLRWARSSFREGMLSLKNYRDNNDAVSWYSIIDTLFRWWFFAIVVLFLYKLVTGNADPHFTEFALWQYLLFGAVGFLVNGYLRQWQHLKRYPEDFFLTPLFLFANFLILTPIEWYGNLTFLKQGWMTRNNK
jgi:cellulose synthase/poly-beta-1,6-N-acetylglucosamine synthase-like glycosyltransferase